MPHVRKRPPDEELDAREWSAGDEITEMDKAKISLAVDRFWARRGELKGRVKGWRGRERERCREKVRDE